MEPSGNNINKRLEEIESTLQEIKTALLGNDFNNKRGYLNKVDNLEERVSSLEKNQLMAKVFLFSAGITGGAGLVKVLEAFF
jgi:hypothetical protein